MSGTGQQQPGDPAAGRSAGEVPGYDRRRSRARVALLEQEVTLAEALADLEEAAARPALPPGTGDTWAPVRARAERAAAGARRWIAGLVPVVGDPETVPDEHGRLPRDRRDWFLTEFTVAAGAEAAGLTGTLPALRASLRAVPGKQERAGIREQVSRATARLAYLQALPPFTAGSMCSECPTPAAWHATGVTFCLQSGAVLRGPCPSWPVWNATITAGLTRFAEATRPHPAVTAPRPVPQPLAVIADGSPVEDLIARLTQIQAVHPGAQVRRGRKGSWEIWPLPPAQTTSER